MRGFLGSAVGIMLREGKRRKQDQAEAEAGCNEASEEEMR